MEYCIIYAREDGTIDFLRNYASSTYPFPVKFFRTEVAAKKFARLEGYNAYRIFPRMYVEKLLIN